MPADRSVVLWREDPRRGRLVAACCRHARAAGVGVPMPIAQAVEMVQRSGSEPWLIPHDRDADDEALRRIAWRIQQQITPLVELESLDEKPWAGCPRHQRESLLGDISGVAHLFGGESGLLRAADQLLQAIGLSGRMAIADSVGAAWATAHFGFSRDAVASSQWIVASAATRSRLEPLPIEALRIDLATAETLTRLGIERVGELLQLPRDGLAARLGRRLVRRIEQALGDQQEPLSVEAAPAEDQATMELEYPTSDQAIVADRVGRLVEKIRTGLAARQRGALRVTCRLDLAIPPPLIFEIGLFAPTVDSDHLSSLIIHRLENTRLSADVLRVTVSVTLSGPLRTAQACLFETDPSTEALGGSSISRLVDSLSGRMGRDRVLRVDWQDDPLPENAFRAVPLTGNRVVAGRSKRRRNPPPAQHSPAGPPRTLRLPSPEDAMRRPLYLFPDPIPLAVAFDDDRFHQRVTGQQVPRRIRLSGAVHRVVRHWGPERIETGWWKGPSIRRDYYRIETDRGRRWWIFRELTRSGGRWMLHGQFD